jgi:diacylglycerol kinase (ATP)
MASEDPIFSAFKSRSGLLRVAGAMRYSLAGLASAWKHEHAFRQELCVIVPAVVVALLLPVTALEKLLLGSTMVLVLVVELLNSAIEAVVDRVSLERHPLSKNAKDFGSAAVMLSVLLAVVAWAVVLWGVFVT